MATRHSIGSGPASVRPVTSTFIQKSRQQRNPLTVCGRSGGER